MYAVGYEAMSMRDLAAGIDRQQGSLYKYFNSKQDLLFRIIEDHMKLVLEKMHEAIDGTSSPADKLVQFVKFHILYHIDKRELLYVVTSELRSLTSENKARIVAYRKRYEEALRDILVEGVQSDDFHICDTRVATFSILSLLTSVSVWYNSDGELTPDDIVQTHLKLIFNGVRQPRL